VSSAILNDNYFLPLVYVGLQVDRIPPQAAVATIMIGLAAQLPQQLATTSPLPIPSLFKPLAHRMMQLRISL